MADFGGAELDAFRTEVRDWLAANYPAELKDPKAKTDPEAVWGGRRLRGLRSDPQIVWMKRMAEKGWTAPTWPKDYGGGGLAPATGPRAGAGDRQQGRAAAALVRHLDARARAARIRQRGAEEGTPAEDRARRDPLVPGLFRAGRGLRPRRPADQGARTRAITG